MKKLFLFAFILLSVCAGKVMAQNIQLGCRGAWRVLDSALRR